MITANIKVCLWSSQLQVIGLVDFRIGGTKGLFVIHILNDDIATYGKECVIINAPSAVTKFIIYM